MSGPVIRSPSPPPASPPVISMIGVPPYPGCDSPSISTAPVIAGRGESGAIVCTPVAGMAKSMVLVAPVTALESRMAWRSEPGPLSAVVVTVNRPLVTTIWTWAGIGDETVRLGVQVQRGLP